MSLSSILVTECVGPDWKGPQKVTQEGACNVEEEQIISHFVTLSPD